MKSRDKMNINVMTANIRFANEGDGENNWVYRKDYVSELIVKEGIHLLATQEGRETQIKELSSLLPQLELIESHRDWINERMYPTLYFAKNLFKLIRSGDIWLSLTPDIPASKSFGSMFPRLCTYAELSFINQDYSILVINCHLDHLEEEIRLEQIRVLIREVDKINSHKLPIILMGDFNSGPYDSVRTELQSSTLNLYDPWIKEKKVEKSSFHKFDGIDPTGDQLRIDWVLLDQSLDSSSIELIEDHRKGKYPSDHFFVKASISL